MGGIVERPGDGNDAEAVAAAPVRRFPPLITFSIVGTFLILLCGCPEGPSDELQYTGRDGCEDPAHGTEAYFTNLKDRNMYIRDDYESFYGRCLRYYGM